MTALRPALPFPLLGFDTDNDSVFMNETIRDWCEAAQVAFTRSRPYRKNDQAHVEQKNGRWCGGWRAVADTPALPQPPNWRASIAICGST
ncbi:MAG: hypothetical protein R6V26_12725 [Roseovarius sp.]